MTEVIRLVKCQYTDLYILTINKNRSFLNLNYTGPYTSFARKQLISFVKRLLFLTETSLLWFTRSGQDAGSGRPVLIEDLQDQAGPKECSSGP